MYEDFIEAGRSKFVLCVRGRKKWKRLQLICSVLFCAVMMVCMFPPPTHTHTHTHTTSEQKKKCIMCCVTVSKSRLCAWESRHAKFNPFACFHPKKKLIFFCCNSNYWHFCGSVLSLMMGPLFASQVDFLCLIHCWRREGRKERKKERIR